MVLKKNHMFIYTLLLAAVVIVLCVIVARKDYSSEVKIIKAASLYSGAPVVKVIEEEGNAMLLQCYEVIEDGVSTHTATFALLEVDKASGNTTDLLTEEVFNIYTYMEVHR